MPIGRSKFGLRHDVWCQILAALIGATTAFVAFALYFQHSAKFAFIDKDVCGIYGSSAYCILDADWNSSTYLSTISAFYGTIITTLVGLLALVGAFAFFAVRTSALRHAEETMHIEVLKYFTESKSGETRLNELLDEISKVKNRSIANRLDEIETQLSDQGLICLPDLEVAE